MTATLRKVSSCRVCRGELVFHDSKQEGERIWAHTDRILAETAGHTADPDPADTEIIEIA